ncbi:MAG TPA: hypothetical protein VNO35_03155 [Steroidobacteraceae bacterium]|nr:hypothetical protein [Steroidobacteraceae bacterium]
MPDRVTTNICFGGSNLRTAYITLSSTGRLLATEWPNSGLKLHWSDTIDPREVIGSAQGRT